MLPPSASARQQAHDLVDRLTPLQLSALIDLFEPLVRVQAPLARAPFLDELPLDAEERSVLRARAAFHGRAQQRTA